MHTERRLRAHGMRRINHVQVRAVLDEHEIGRLVANAADERRVPLVQSSHVRHGGEHHADVERQSDDEGDCDGTAAAVPDDKAGENWRGEHRKHVERTAERETELRVVQRHQRRAWRARPTRESPRGRAPAGRAGS